MKRVEITDSFPPLKLVSARLPQTPKGARLKTTFTGLCNADLNFTDDSGLFQRPGKLAEENLDN